MLKGPIILITDFGLSDPFMGQMKCVIEGISPGARVIDLTHDVPPQNIEIGGFYIKSSLGYFPEESIIVGVVDPGVGTDRKGMLLNADGIYYVGPDNGLFFSIFKTSKEWKAVSLENKKYMLADVSNTFHGRDIFSPVAAHLRNGVQMDEFGSKIESPVEMKLVEPVVTSERITGRVINVDRFGNLWTNITHSMLAPGLDMIFIIRDAQISGISKTYGDGHEPGDPIAIINSFGLLEIAVPNWDASAILDATAGDTVEVFLK